MQFILRLNQIVIGGMLAAIGSGVVRIDSLH
jgi:hypothetical protein